MSAPSRGAHAQGSNPYKLLFPVIVAFVCIDIYSVNFQVIVSNGELSSFFTRPIRGVIMSITIVAILLYILASLIRPRFQEKTP
jgi:TctA family transporter